MAGMTGPRGTADALSAQTSTGHDGSVRRNRYVGRWSCSNRRNAECGVEICCFDELPRHIARKHLAAAMRRAIRPGVPTLRQMTPPIGVKRGRRKAGEKPKTTGALRRSVTTTAKAYVRGRSGSVVGKVGYRLGFESRKANWTNFGTKTGVRPQSFLEKFELVYQGPAAQGLAHELAISLERAASELASGKNPGRRGRGVA